MTKDRRLGKGLAALLGTPIEETPTIRDATVAPATTAQTPPTHFEPSAAKGSASGSSIPGSSIPGSSIPGSSAAAKSPVRRVPLRDESQPTPEAARDTASGGSRAIQVDQIDNNPFQPRREFGEEEIASLAESIREHEQLQPILVRQVGERYQLISGERRLRATIHAGLTTIRAEVREADDRLVAELAIVENLQRKDLDPIEKAMSFRRYIEQHQCTQEDLAKRLKIDRSTIANLMRLLELPEMIQAWIGQRKLTAGHARALLPLGEEEQQQEFAKQIVDNAWSVREVEQRVAEVLEAEDHPSGTPSPPKPRSRLTPQIASLEQQLRLALGTKTEIRQNAKGRGKITISFANSEEFERICHLICPAMDRKAA